MTSANLLKFVLTLCICSSVFGQDPEFVERAETGDAMSQLYLGYMYDNGDGVPEDDIEGYARYNVAVALGNEAAKVFKEDLTARMSKEDISAAQKRSKEIWEALEGRKVE